MFHMQCIQKWVREGIYQHAYKSPDGETPSKDIPWHWYFTPLHLILFYFQKFFFWIHIFTRLTCYYSPKCRTQYQQKDCPSKYLCFCGKEANPKFDPWLVPHSCGQTCGQNLKPECGHTCLLLCHPGNPEYSTSLTRSQMCVLNIV